MPWRAASRFVAGEKPGDAIRAIRELNAKGINATLDLLGEHTSTADEAANATEDILAILDEIDKAKVRANVSIKLTQIGMGLDERICQQNLIRILERAREHNNFIRIDIEDTPYTDITISIYHAMLERGPADTGLAADIWGKGECRQQYFHKVLMTGSWISLACNRYFLSPFAR